MFENAFGHNFKIANITTIMIDDFVEDCRHLGNAPATIKLKLASLSTAMTYCVERGYLDKKPTFPKIKVRMRDWFSFLRKKRLRY